MIKFKEHLTEETIQEAFQYHLDNNIPLNECIFRYGSEMYFSFVNHLRDCYNNNLLENYQYTEDDLELINSDIGEFVMYEDQMVPLDMILIEENPPLNKPTRGGPKKFQVHVRDPKTGNIKKIAFGDTTGLSVKYDNPERKKAFAARHKCSDANDKLSRKYWSCRINKYLGKTPQARAGYW